MAMINVRKFPGTNKVILFIGFFIMCSSGFALPKIITTKKSNANTHTFWEQRPLSAKKNLQEPKKAKKPSTKQKTPIRAVYKPTGIPLQDALTITDFRKRLYLTKKSLVKTLLMFTNNIDNTKQPPHKGKSAEDNSFASNSYLSYYIKSFSPYSSKSKTKNTKSNNKQTIAEPSPIPIKGDLMNNNPPEENEGAVKLDLKLSKEEIGVDFFDTFRNDLMNNPDLSTLFPSASSFVGGLKKSNEEKIDIMLMREAFQKDLMNLKVNLHKITSDHTVYYGNSLDISSYLKSSYFIAQQLVEDKVGPGKIIANLPDSLFEGLPNQNGRACLQTEKLFSEALRGAPNSDKYWGSEEDFQQLFSNDDCFKLFIGLLEQKAANANIQFFMKDGSHKSLAKIIDESYIGGKASLNDYKDYFSRLMSSTVPVAAGYEKYKARATKSFNDGKDYIYLGDFMSLTKELSNFESLPKFQLGLGSSDLQGGVSLYAKLMSSLSLDIEYRNYQSAVKNVFKLYDSLYTGGAAQKELDNKGKKTSKNHEENANVGADKSIDNAKKIYTYGTFMASILEARDSFAVSSAIVAAVYPNDYAVVKVPRQTRLAKKKTITTPILELDTSAIEHTVDTSNSKAKKTDLHKHSTQIGITAYAGAFGGYEFINVVKGSWGYKTYGLTVPIGLTFTKVLKSGYSHSLFITALDLGIFSSEIEKNHTASSSTSVGLRNLIAPGLYYSLGLRHTPLFINVGAQAGYSLRDIYVTNKKDISNATYIRESISLCFRLPIWNLRKQPK